MAQYSYQFAGEELLDSWDGARMTGFRMTWYIEDDNGTQVTQTLPSLPGGWKSLEAEPRYTDTELVRTVRLAREARGRNITMEEILSAVFEGNERGREAALINKEEVCSKEDPYSAYVMKPRYYDISYGVLTDSLTYTDTAHEDITEEDIRTGLEILASLRHCPDESVKIYGFIVNLLSTESPRTIIQSVVNTIEHGKIEGITRDGLHEFYRSLDTIFQFQLGGILLAVSSRSQLQAMVDKDRPYFARYREQVDRCLSEIAVRGSWTLSGT